LLPAIQIDALLYEYGENSNTLFAVTDTFNSTNGFKDGNVNDNDYKYDNYGNMIVDKNKKIEIITYNHLNLPTEINFGDSGIIYYIYNAFGVKVAKQVRAPEVQDQTDYLSGFQYKNDELQFFPTAEGYVNVTDGRKFNYVYNYTDHLGNIRLSYTFDDRENELKVLEENHYYPFGLKHSNYNVNIAKLAKDPDGISVIVAPTERSDYQYKYNGKEFQDELGLNTYDYGFRQYMPDIGRFGNIDTLAELAYDLTPNRYCFNNPLRFIDPSGLWEETATGYSTNKAEDIKRYMSYLETENVALNNSPTSEQTSTFIEGEMSPGGHGKTSNGSVLADEIEVTRYKRDNGKFEMVANKDSFDSFWHGVQRSLTPNALDPRTVGQNLLGLTYPGGNNPKSYDRKYSYSYVPQSLAEFPAIGHDRRYDNLGTAGISGLLADTRAISSDYRFVTQELAVAILSTNIKTKIQATVLGGGLGFLASFKTLGHLANPSSGGFGTILMWDSVANRGVNNTPSSK
jgi:RHS repeat-associated protein